MRVLKHIGSNFPERDGGAIIAKKTNGSVWLFNVEEGGNPGDMLEVEEFDLGKNEKGYRAFTTRLSEALGYDDDPAVAVGEIGEDISVEPPEARKLASSIDGRADLLMRLGNNGWWADIDPEPAEVPYKHIESRWVVPSKKQKRFPGAGFAGAGKPKGIAVLLFASIIGVTVWYNNRKVPPSGQGEATG